MDENKILRGVPVQARMVLRGDRWEIDEDSPFTKRVDIPVEPVAAMLAQHFGCTKVVDA